MAGIDSVGSTVEENRLIKGCIIDGPNLGHVDIMGIESRQVPKSTTEKLCNPCSFLNKGEISLKKKRKSRSIYLFHISPNTHVLYLIYIYFFGYMSYFVGILSACDEIFFFFFGLLL